MEELELSGAEASNQILQRDRFAELISFMGLLGSTLAKIAREVRNLQRTEIGELAEPFGKRQIGSSTMPHKRNPVRCERICGLSRILRANVQAALENIVIEHERDLTNSSCERVLLPESFLLVDQMLKESREVLGGLIIRPERMKQNLKLTRGLNMAEAVMIELARRGMDRQKAHEVLRECSSRAILGHISLASAMRKDARIKKHLKDEEITKLLDPQRYLGSASRIVRQVVEDLREAHKK
jgi:adenylosuccinate lyase